MSVRLSRMLSSLNVPQYCSTSDASWLSSSKHTDGKQLCRVTNANRTPAYVRMCIKQTPRFVIKTGSAALAPPTLPESSFSNISARSADVDCGPRLRGRYCLDASNDPDSPKTSKWQTPCGNAARFRRASVRFLRFSISPAALARSRACRRF